MNLSGDGMLDGRFEIKRGQGLSQAIAGELGLNENDCKKLGSVWNEIVQMATEENAFTEDSKKYTEGSILQEGDAFEFTKESFNKIIKLINNNLDKNIEELPVDSSESSPTAEDTDETNTAKGDVDSELVNDETITEEELPSVLLRNTGIITGAMFIKALKDTKYRKELLPSLKNLTPAQQKAFQKACKKYDDAKAARSKVIKDVKSGRKTVSTGKTQLSVIEKSEKELSETRAQAKKARESVAQETKLLKENPKYNEVKTKLAEVEKDIQKLESRKATNKTKKLSPTNEAKLSELKKTRGELLKEKTSFETKLREAKVKQKTTSKNLKNAQYKNKVADANKKVQDAQGKFNTEKAKLNSNPEYKQAKSELTKVNKEIKALESKKNLVQADKARLKELKSSKLKLNSKIIKMSKPLAGAKLELNAAKTEARALEKLASNPSGAKSKVKSTIKNGKHRIRINLKKLPKAEAQVLKAAMNRTKDAAKLGSKFLKGAGKVAKPVMVVVSAVDIYNAYKTGGTKKAVRQTAKLGTSLAGAAVGAKTGAGLGAAVGTAVFPVVGTAVGGFIGGFAGGIAGWWAGEKAYDAAEGAVLPNETPLGQEPIEGTTELEFNSEAELEQFLQEHPEYRDAIE